MIALKSHTSHTHNKYMDHGSERHTKNSLVIEIFFNVWEKNLVDRNCHQINNKKKRKFDRFNDDDDDTIITICCCPIQTVVDGWMDQSFCGSFKCLSTCSQNHKAVYNFDKFDEIITKQQHWIVVKLEKKFDPK